MTLSSTEKSGAADDESAAPDELSIRRQERAAYMREYTRINADRINAQRRARRTAATLERERAYKAANPAKVREYKRTDRAKRPDDYRRWRKAWAASHAEEITARNALEYQEHKDEIAARLVMARAADPERWRKNRAQSSMRRRARLANVEQEHVDRDVVYRRDNELCGICGGKVNKADMSIDHIIPIIYGGPHTYANVQLAHINCNKRRGHRGPAKLSIATF